MSVIVPEASDPPPTRPVLLAERARQMSHLARGGAGQWGDSIEGGFRALWCWRRATMRSLMCSIFTVGAPQEGWSWLNSLLAEHRPDGAIVRLIGATGPARKIAVHRGMLFFLLGILEYREILAFGDNFERFVASLGKASRSHTRSSLRDFDRRGFSHTLTFGQRIDVTDELLSLAERNMPSATPPYRLADYVRDANAQDRPFQSSLRSPDGSLISMVIGYFAEGHALLICQFNAHDAPKIGQAGCSLLHRALLIKRLIQMELKWLIVINGCNGMLRPYCEPVVAQTYVAVSLHPLSWLRCATYVLTRPYLWAFLRRELKAGRTSS